MGQRKSGIKDGPLPPKGVMLFRHGTRGLGLNKPVPNSYGNSLGAVASAKFLQDADHVSLDGIVTDRKTSSNTTPRSPIISLGISSPPGHHYTNLLDELNTNSDSKHEESIDEHYLKRPGRPLNKP